jgi:Tol biopolymer transport system component
MFHISETINKNYRYFGLVAVIILGTVSIFGSGGGDGGVGTPPVITSVSPAQSSDSAVVTALVTAQFSIDMEEASIDANSFTLVDNTMTAVTASNISYDVGTRIATFVPSTDLESGMEYIATLTTAVQDSAGNHPLSTNYVWSFRIAPTLVPVSLDSNGVYGNSASSNPAIDQTGRYIVFVSINNLVPGINAGGIAQIYRKDTLTGGVRIVSTDNTGLIAADGASTAPVISVDGRYIAFESSATNLVTGDTNGIPDVFLHDTQTTTTTRVSVATGGTQANGASSAPVVSVDGRYIAFESSATNLVTGDTNGIPDVFLHDTQTTTTTRVSVATGGAQANGASSAPAISANGRYIAFQSTAPDLVTGDTNTVMDIFLHDTQTPSTTSRVSVTTVGAEANGASSTPAISADGRYIAFQSIASDLVAGDTNTVMDIFLHDTQTPSTSRVSITSGGAEANGASSAPAISGDGRYIAFQSAATDLIATDTNGVTDIYLRDYQTPSTVRLSLPVGGAQPTSESTEAAISSDGRYVGFSSLANLDTANDTNGVRDIYRAHRTHQ